MSLNHLLTMLIVYNMRQNELAIQLGVNKGTITRILQGTVPINLEARDTAHSNFFPLPLTQKTSIGDTFKLDIQPESLYQLAFSALEKELAGKPELINIRADSIRRNISRAVELSTDNSLHGLAVNEFYINKATEQLKTFLLTECGLSDKRKTVLRLWSEHQKATIAFLKEAHDNKFSNISSNMILCQKNYVLSCKLKREVDKLNKNSKNKKDSRNRPIYLNIDDPNIVNLDKPEEVDNRQGAEYIYLLTSMQTIEIMLLTNQYTEAKKLFNSLVMHFGYERSMATLLYCGCWKDTRPQVVECFITMTHLTKIKCF